MNYDIIVIGSGPGGYVTAIRASQLGFKTAIIEKENLGGICLNWGCIPTKALLKSAQVFKYINHAEDFGLNKVEASFDFPNVVQRSRGVAEKMSKGVEFLMKKNKIDVIFGTAKVKPGKKVAVEKDGAVTEYTAEHIVLATGARSRELPNLPQDGKKVIGYRQALTLPKQPKSMIVVGSGAIGVEFAYFYATLGTQVTVVEFMPNIVPVEDEDVSKHLEKSFKKAKIKVMTNASVESVDTSGEGVKAQVKTEKGIVELQADILLSAVGITANIENIGLEEVGNYLRGENKRTGCRAYRLRQYPRMYILHARDSISRAYRETGERKRLRNKSRKIPILCKWKSYCEWRYRWLCESNFRCEIWRMAWLSYDRNRRYRNDSRGCGGKKIRNHRT